MGTGTRVYYIGDEEETLIRYPVQRYFDLVLRRNKDPDLEFAGKLVYFAVAYYRTQHRRPSKLIQIDYSKTQFDKQGRVDDDALMEHMSLALNCLQSIPGTIQENISGIIDGRAHFARVTYRDRCQWTPPAGLQETIIDDLFGSRE